MLDIDEIVKYSKHLKLLYVEDNQDSREMTSMILEDFFDDIVVAVDGEDGYEKFINNKIEIVITDINMPKMNGLEMVKKIREQDQDVFVIILSAHNEEQFFMESIGLHVDEYLLKPIDLEQLIKAISKAVQKYSYMHEAKENLHFLKVYQEATNKTSIVSKTDINGIITYVNDRFCEMSGYTREEILGKSHNIIRHPDNPKEMFEDIWHTIKDEKKIWRGVVRNKTKDNKSYYVDSLIMPILDLEGNIIEYISLRNDITNIMNPAVQLNDALKNAKSPVLIYMKLDNYENFIEFYSNDTLDEIQQKVGKYLQEYFSKFYEFDKIYILGNGEYALLLHGDILDDEKKFVEKLKEELEEIQGVVIDLGDVKYDISIVANLTFAKEKILESAKLGIRKLLHSKHQFMVANNLANLAAVKAQENLNKIYMIKDAIANNKIVSYFQPIINNATKEIMKYESLVRLIDNDGNVLTPFHFLDVAKQSNYYIQITKQVLKSSFDALSMCHQDISINLSAIDIEQREIRKEVYELLQKHQDVAHRIIFELLEDENVKNFKVVKDFISKVKSYGVRIAIDDFGSGYSNYERLLDYQPDILKIDGSLIKNIQTDEYAQSVVKSIVTFARERGLQTIGEFIENQEIYEIAKSLGVHCSQGYYFGKPEPMK